MGAINYIWDEENDSLLEEVDDDGNVIASYTNEPGPFGKVISQERNGVTSYYHYDGQGSTVALTDDNQNVTDTYVYSAFGELVSSTGTTVNPFRYLGQYGYYTDVETNDSYIRARSYNPSLGRWLTRDPLEFRGSKWNLYEYVSSAPLDKVDPSGKANLWNPFTWTTGGNTWGEFIDPRVGYQGFGASYGEFVNPWDGSGPPPVDWIDSALAGGTMFGQGTAVIAGTLAGGIWVVQIVGFEGVAIAEIVILKNGNIFKVISRPFKCGFRVDPAHHGKPWGHSHWWKW